MASSCMPGRPSVALFTRTAKLNLNSGAHGARCAWAMAVHHAVGISRQRNSGYKPSTVNIMAQGLSTPDPSLSPTQLSIRRGRATTTHYTHTIRLAWWCRATLHWSFPWVAHWASLWGLPQRWHAKGACATPNKKKKEGEYFTTSNDIFNFNFLALVVSEILGGPKFTLGGRVPPVRSLAEIFLYRKRVLYYV